MLIVTLATGPMGALSLHTALASFRGSPPHPQIAGKYNKDGDVM